MFGCANIQIQIYELLFICVECGAAIVELIAKKHQLLNCYYFKIIFFY